MPKTLLEHLASGQFIFLRPDAEEMRRVVPEIEDVLPTPQQIVLEDETATPLVGFPILRNPAFGALQSALDHAIEIEEEAQRAYLNRDTFDSRVYRNRWERYKTQLAQVTENVVLSNHGQGFPAIFWLHHSMQIARRLKETPKRLVRRDLAFGREHGDAIKYKVCFKLLDRVVALTQDVCSRLAAEVEDEEEVLFPTLLARMRDNVLVFTEDHISPDLSELGGYFSGHLRIDGRDLRRRLSAIAAWHERVIQADDMLRAAATALLGVDAQVLDDGRALLHRTGYLTFLSKHPSYSAERFLPVDQVAVWEQLLVKLKEFEIYHALRKMTVPLERENDNLVSRDRSVNTTWVGGPPVLHVSQATRPIDFMAPWVVDPQVQRYGLVYDISDFSATLMMLGRAESSVLDNAFRMMFRFQRRINGMAQAQQLKLEKYLGDGAFYSGRRARQLLKVAVHLQRSYKDAIERGFPFDRGLRIAMNYGHYRLLPLESGDRGRHARYEFFGHGLVELSRLATGKTTQEIDDFKTYLVAQGYPEATVNKFFAPMLRRSSELVSHREESRRFYAYINANHALINEGIVATEDFVSRLGTFERLFFTREQDRGYIVVPLEEDIEAGQRAGLRRLGMGKFKGLGQMPVYEVVDLSDRPAEELKEMPKESLMSALQRLFASTITARKGSSGG